MRWSIRGAKKLTILSLGGKVELKRQSIHGGLSKLVPHPAAARTLMNIRYFKRYRMELDIQGRSFGPTDLPTGYVFSAWDKRSIADHASAKYHSFHREIDAEVFPCLGDADGCVRLMREISRKDGFIPAATWLLCRQNLISGESEPCGTIQGIRDRHGFGAVQNLGIIPECRGIGLGEILLRQALHGFGQVGLSRVYLEVTAENTIAIGLYERLGFVRTRTSYKAVGAAESTIGV